VCKKYKTYFVGRNDRRLTALLWWNTEWRSNRFKGTAICMYYASRGIPPSRRSGINISRTEPRTKPVGRMKKRISKIEIRMYSNVYLYLPARYICICHKFIKQISTSVLAENEAIGIQMRAFRQKEIFESY